MRFDHNPLTPDTTLLQQAVASCQLHIKFDTPTTEVLNAYAYCLYADKVEYSGLGLIQTSFVAGSLG